MTLPWLPRFSMTWLCLPLEVSPDWLARVTEFLVYHFLLTCMYRAVKHPQCYFNLAAGEDFSPTQHPQTPHTHPFPFFFFKQHLIVSNLFDFYSCTSIYFAECKSYEAQDISVLFDDRSQVKQHSVQHSVDAQMLVE